MEPLAVQQYENSTGNVVATTGLHMHNNLRWGASPDGLVRTASGDEGLVEVKCSWVRRNKGTVPRLQVCPPEYYDQIQGQLEILNLQWCDLVTFVPPNSTRPGKN